MKQMTLAEVAVSENLELGTSSWFRIDQERINQFAEATEDRQWIHVDEDKAKESELGGTIAHGFLVLSLLPKLFFEVVQFNDIERMINYGTDKVRFIAPVPSGGEIQLHTKIVSARRRLGGVLMRIQGSIHLRDPEKENEVGRRCLVTEMLFLGFERSSDEAGDS